MSFKVNMGEIAKKIEEKIEKAVDLSIDTTLAKETATQIKIRTRLGFGIDTNGNQIKLAPLSDSYKAQRRGEIAFWTDKFGRVRSYIPDEKPRLHGHTTPAKSNLTNTGEMLDSIDGYASDGKMFIKLNGRREDGYTNEEIASFVEEQDRVFMGLTNSEKNALARKIKNRVLSNLK